MQTCSAEMEVSSSLKVTADRDGNFIALRVLPRCGVAVFVNTSGGHQHTPIDFLLMLAHVVWSASWPVSVPFPSLYLCKFPPAVVTAAVPGPHCSFLEFSH